MADRTLPAGWRWVRFGDVVRQVKDRVDPETCGLDRYVAGEHMDTDDLRIRQWGTIGDGYLGPAFHMRFRPGQVLYGSRRTYLRKVAIAEFEGICANTTFIVESATENLLPEFLPLVMTSEAFHQHSIEQSKGSVNPYINFRDLTWYEFRLPPVDEQAEIVRAMSLTHGVWASYEALEEAATRHRDALVAEGWSSNSPHQDLGEIAAITVGIVVKPAALYVAQGGVPALRSLNVSPGRLDDTDVVRISAAGHDSHRKSRLSGGEVVVVRSGTPGVAAVIPADGVVRNAIDLLIVRCGPELHPDFLACYLNSSEGRGQMFGRSGGTAQQHLNASQLQRVRVPVPSREVQSQVVGLVAASTRLSHGAEQARERLAPTQRALRERLVSSEREF